MRYLKHMALLAVLLVPLAYSQAQVRVGIGVAVGPGYAAGPPVCAYGYYNYYPYACAPYGFYGPDYFVDGVFVGAGPWYHWGHPAWFWNRGFVGRGWDHDGWRHEGWDHGWNRGGWDHQREGYGRGEWHGGNAFHGGGEFHGGSGFRGGESHGGGFHGGGRR